jgi:hypothetical protein
MQISKNPQHVFSSYLKRGQILQPLPAVEIQAGKQFTKEVFVWNDWFAVK